MFKAIPFLYSNRSPEYRGFLEKCFHIGMLGKVDGKCHQDIEPLFYNWNGIDMSNWTKFTSIDQNYMIEFYGSGATYKIINNVGNKTIVTQFPYPNNIEEFISDCYRCGIQLYWSNYSIKNNDIKHMISPVEYKGYIEDLLEKIGKS